MYASVHTDRSGRVFVSNDRGAAGMAGTEAVPFDDAIPLPPGTQLVPLARDAVAYDRAGRARTLVRGRLALAALLPAGHVRTLVPAYVDDVSAGALDALPYTAVAADDRGEVLVAAIRVGEVRPSDVLDDGAAPAGPAIRAHPANPLARQLARCAKENECRAARSGLGRGVLPVPIGAPAAERPRLPLALSSGYAGTPVERAAFRPDADEIAGLAVDHLERGGTGVAFGRACDGEPLALVRVVEKAVAQIRVRAPGARIQLETTGSDPAALRRAIDAGVTSVTVRIGSARDGTYALLHGPVAHRWNDVRASLEVAADRRVTLTIALLLLPGLTDRPAETDALVALLGDLTGGRVEIRDLGADPLRVLRAFPHEQGIGVRALLRRLEEADHFALVDTPGAAAVVDA